MLTHPRYQLAAIGAIDPNPPQFLAMAAHPRKQLSCAFGVGDRSSGDDHRQHQAQGVDQQVAFAALDQLAVIEATLASHGSGFDTLAVQTASRGMLMPAGATAHFGPQGIVDALPCAIIAPDTEVMVDALPGR